MAKKEDLMEEIYSLERENEKLRYGLSCAERELYKERCKASYYEYNPIRIVSSYTFPPDPEISGWSILQGIWLTALTVLLIVEMVS